MLKCLSPGHEVKTKDLAYCKKSLLSIDGGTTALFGLNETIARDIVRYFF